MTQADRDRLSPVERNVLDQLQDGREKYGLELVVDSGGVLSATALYVHLNHLEEKGLIEGREESVKLASGELIPRRLYRLPTR